MSGWPHTRVLVTGARGFIGSHLCRRLLDEGATVHGASSVAAGDALAVPGLRWETVDLTDAEQTRALLARCKPEVVFHLAGTVTGSLDLAAVEPTFTGNLLPSVHLLCAVAEQGVRRLVMAGSGREPEDEPEGAAPGSPYAAAKWASTSYARLFHRLYDVPVVVARLMMVYGPGQWDTTKVLPYVITSLLEGRSPAVGSGASEFDWVFVSDAVEGLLATATADGIDGSAIDLGSGTLTSVRDVLAQAAGIVGAPDLVRFGAIPDRRLDVMRAARVDRTHALTGWSSRTSLSDGLRQTVEWYRRTRSSVKPD